MVYFPSEKIAERDGPLTRSEFELFLTEIDDTTASRNVALDNACERLVATIGPIFDVTDDEVTQLKEMVNSDIFPPGVAMMPRDLANKLLAIVAR